MQLVDDNFDDRQLRRNFIESCAYLNTLGDMTSTGLLYDPSMKDNVNGIRVSLHSLKHDIHSRNRAAGWWNNLHTGAPLNRNLGELICLVHSEVSEAMEGHRKDLKDDKLPHRKMIEVELADVLLRLFDIAGGFGVDFVKELDRVVKAGPKGFHRHFLMREDPKEWNVGEALSKIHTALSASLVPVAHDPLHPGVRHHVDETHLFMAVLATCHIANGLNLDIAGALHEKADYNASRADHKPEARKAVGGKAY